MGLFCGFFFEKYSFLILSLTEFRYLRFSCEVYRSLKGISNSQIKTGVFWARLGNSNALGWSTVETLQLDISNKDIFPQLLLLFFFHLEIIT